MANGWEPRFCSHGVGPSPTDVSSSPTNTSNSVSVSGFPNLFVLTGPNTLPSGHSTLVGIESSVEYIIRLLRHADKGPAARVKINVKPRAQAIYNACIQRELSKLVYTDEVPNWYIHGSSGKNTLIWPGSQFQIWWSRCVRGIRWDDFDFEIRKL